MTKALLIMLDQLDGEAIYTREFEPQENLFRDIYKTTWPELEERYLIKPRHTIGTQRYELTGDGWYKAMELIWDDNKDVLNQWLGMLMKALKDELNARDEDVWVDFEPFVIASGLPLGFVYNAIESNLIEIRLSKKGAHWYESQPGQTIEIPSRFGLPLL